MDRRCEIVIGKEDAWSGVETVYWFSEDITQMELVGELAHLALFYDTIVLPKKLPPHILRKEVEVYERGSSVNMLFRKGKETLQS